MRLKNRKLLADYMAANDFTQARLARYASCSRQFVHMLISGERTTCTAHVAQRIEEAVRVLPGTLFEANVSPASTQRASRRGTKVPA